MKEYIPDGLRLGATWMDKPSFKGTMESGQKVKLI